MANPNQTLNQNQFINTPIPGLIDLQFDGSVISGVVSNNESVGISAGQAVTMEDSAGGTPNFLAAVNNDDAIFGFAAFNLKDIVYLAGNRLEIALKGSVMYMMSGGAISRGGKVEIVASTQKVIASGGFNPVVGFAYDKATAANQLIRVWIDSPQIGGAGASVQTLNVTATLAQINAGLVLVPAAPGKKITVTNYVARVTGAFATGTAVILESTNGTPVLVTTLAEAGLTNGAVLLPSSGNTTLGAGFATPLGTGDGLQVVNSGSAQTAGTNIQFTINYIQQ